MLHPQQYIALHKLAPNITPTSPPPQHIYIHIYTFRFKSFPEQTPTRQALHNQPVTRRPPASSRHHMHTRSPQAQRTHAPILTHISAPLHRWRQRSTKVPQIGSRSNSGRFPRPSVTQTCTLRVRKREVAGNRHASGRGGQRPRVRHWAARTHAASFSRKGHKVETRITQSRKV